MRLTIHGHRQHNFNFSVDWKIFKTPAWERKGTIIHLPITRLFLNPNPQDPALCSSVNVNGGKGLASLMTNGFKCLLTGIFDKFFRTYFHMGFFMSILHMRRLSLKEIMSATQSLKAGGTHGCRYLLKNMSTANNRFKCLNKPPY